MFYKSHRMHRQLYTTADSFNIAKFSFKRYNFWSSYIIFVKSDGWRSHVVILQIKS